jgi:uracil-DNA glycosylase
VVDVVDAVDVLGRLPDAWRAAMSPYLDPAVVARLAAFVADEYANHTVYPPLPDLYAALRLCPPEATRVLILGQDPYHRPGQAHGLSFSVRAGVPVPPSLRNIFKELTADLGVAAPASGDLTAWAEQGVLLLNAVLTVRAAAPASHAGRGWEHVTDAAIRALDARPRRVVFALWGGYARRKAGLITGAQHVVLESGHPSPMNPTGFLGTRPFSAMNRALTEAGLAPVRWGASPAGA